MKSNARCLSFSLASLIALSIAFAGCDKGEVEGPDNVDVGSGDAGVKPKRMRMPMPGTASEPGAEAGSGPGEAPTSEKPVVPDRPGPRATDDVPNPGGSTSNPATGGIGGVESPEGFGGSSSLAGGGTGGTGLGGGTSSGRDNPADGGFPDATTTGVPVGVQLSVVPAMTISEDGAVVEDVEVRGAVTIRANDVTLRRVKVIRQAQSENYGVDTGSGDYSGTLLEDIEVDGAMLGSGTGSGDIGVCCSNYTLRRANVHGFRTGAVMANQVTIEDSYFHDNLPHGDIHKNSVQAHGGTNLTVRHNTMDITSTYVSAALALYGDFAQIRNATIENNLFNTSGAYCVYAGSVPDKPYPTAENVVITGNAFGNKYNDLCGIWGPVAAYDPNAQGSAWEGNYWVESGDPIGLDQVKHAP